MTDDSLLQRLIDERGPANKQEKREEGLVAADYEPVEYKPFTTATNKRQPGFSIAMVESNARYWIFYHSIRRLRLQELNGRDYLQFSHDNLAVTIEGKRLVLLLNLIGEGRLKAVFEPTGMPAAGRQITDTTINAIRVTDIEAQEVGSGPRLAKSA